MIRMAPSSDAPAPISWMSSKDAADYLGVSNRTLYKFVNSGQLPGYQFGRVFRFRRDELDAFIETLRIQPGSLDHLLPDTTDDRL